jgi:light-regulated signal transduction histidine kinase (bacteriophytochrome)
MTQLIEEQAREIDDQNRKLYRYEVKLSESEEVIEDLQAKLRLGVVTFVESLKSKAKEVDEYIESLVVTGKFLLDQRTNAIKRSNGVEITEEQVKLFGTKFQEHEWNDLVEQLEDMRSDASVIETVIKTYGHSHAIVAEA